MRRYVVWAVSAAVAVPVYLVAQAVGAPGWAALVFTAIGALAGAAIGTAIMQRRGEPMAPPPPRGRDSGRKAE
ncbi:MAG TPA: hypothetical protein VI759_03795 [Dehalococcoidia bacterium]|nr:hypothetical protein [Dehalococcoidia bacterium]